MSDEETPVESQEADAAPVEAVIEAPPVDTAAQEKDRLGRETQKRIARLTYEREEARREVARLKAAPTAATAPTFSDQVHQSAVQMRAEEKFTEECNATFEKGKSEFTDFEETVTALQDIGMGDNINFLDAVNDLPNGPAVLQYLAANMEDAANILKMKPVKMAMKLATLSGEVAKPVKKALSNTPPPADSVGGKAVQSSRNPEDMSMPEFAKWFQEQRTTRR